MVPAQVVGMHGRLVMGVLLAATLLAGCTTTPDEAAFDDDQGEGGLVNVTPGDTEESEEPDGSAGAFAPDYPRPPGV